MLEAETARVLDSFRTGKETSEIWRFVANGQFVKLFNDKDSWPSKYHALNDLRNHIHSLVDKRVYIQTFHYLLDEKIVELVRVL